MAMQELLEMRLGDVSLGTYVSPQLRQEEVQERLSEIDSELRKKQYQLGMLSTSLLLPVEEKARRDLEGEISALLYNRKRESDFVNTIYPAIDPSFLSLTNDLTKVVKRRVGEDYLVNILTGVSEYEPIIVPKFSVYRVFGKNRFNIGHVGRLVINGLIFGKLPSIFEKQFFKNVVIPEYREIISFLNLVVPSETKERIRDARKYFRRKDLFFISETKPEDWNVNRHTICPLVVGVKNERCYLIDKFDSTKLEDYVADEFTS